MIYVGIVIALLIIWIGIKNYLKDEERSFTSFIKMLIFFLVAYIIVIASFKSYELRIRLGLFIHQIDITMSRLYANLGRELNVSGSLKYIRDIFFEIILLVGLIVGYFASK